MGGADLEKARSRVQDVGGTCAAGGRGAEARVVDVVKADGKLPRRCTGSTSIGVQKRQAPVADGGNRYYHCKTGLHAGSWSEPLQ